MITKYASNIDTFPNSQDETISERRAFKSLSVAVPKAPPKDIQAIRVNINPIIQAPFPSTKKALRGDALRKFMAERTIHPSKNSTSPEQLPKQLDLVSPESLDKLQSNSPSSLTPHGSTDSLLSTQAQTSQDGTPESLHVVETKTTMVAAANEIISQPAPKTTTLVQAVAADSVNHLEKWFTEFQYEPKAQPPVVVQKPIQFVSNQFASRSISYPIQQAYAPVFGQRQMMYIRY